MQRNNSPFQQGTYVVKGDTIELVDVDDSPSSCPPASEPGIYKWSFDGKELKLEREKDTCTGRNGDTPRTWTRE